MTITAEVPSGWRKLSLPAKVRLRWRLKARPKQLTPDEHILCPDPEHCKERMIEARRRWPAPYQSRRRARWLRRQGHVAWQVWLILAGRGWGKTRTGAEDIVKFALEHPGCRIALVAATFADGRDTMVEGESGIKGLLPAALILNWNRSIGELILMNGSRMKIFSAEEPERLRGPQHHRAWCDELAAWKYMQKTWDQLMFGLRLGDNPQVIITTTPKPLKFLRKQVAKSKDPKNGIVITTGSTFENAKNLARTALEMLKETYLNTRMGRQELNAEILEDAEGSIFRQIDIDAKRLEEWQVPDLDEIVTGRRAVAIDPAVTSTASSDETGIVVGGLSSGPCPICTRAENPKNRAHAFILEDATPGRVSSAEWGATAIRAYRGWHAGRVICEVNNGGDLVEDVLQAIHANLPVRQVRASKGKTIRAEPIGALYERGMVHHVGHFAKLEAQMVTLGVEEGDDESETGDDEPKSPDRADALVWLLTDLMVPSDSTKVVGTAQDRRGQANR